MCKLVKECGKESVAAAAGEVKVDNAASAENFALASRN